MMLLFRKGQLPTPTPSQEIPKPPRQNQRHAFQTVFGANTQITGEFTDENAENNIRIDGHFSGTLNIRGNILVGETGEVEADLDAKNVSVAGLVRGDVVGSKVHLLSTAKVWGDVTARSFVIDEGAFLRGTVTMNTAPQTTEENPPHPVAETEDVEETVEEEENPSDD